QQYVDEILIPYLVPLYEKCGGAEDSVQTIEDGASYHCSAYTRRRRLEHGVVWMEWPSHSLDLNPIENVWFLFKRMYRKEVWRRQRIPSDREELIALAQEVWEGLPWPKIYKLIDCMPDCIVSCLCHHGGPT
ncbi:hypothetical protein L873DRAFT_1596408, partial [Choiromyces venosus 120613-1]